MRIRTVAQGIVVSAIAWALLTLTWLCAPLAGQASSITLIPPVSTPPPDPRWLELVQAGHPHHSNTPQGTTPTLNYHLTDGYLAGRASTAATVVISVTRRDIQLTRVSAAPAPIDDGYIYTAYLNVESAGSQATGGGGGYGPPQPGDVIWVTQASATISMTIPTLTALSDATADTVYGVAPISQPVTLYLFPFDAPDVTLTQTTTADASSQYQVQWTPTDVRPRDSGYVAFAEAPDRRAYARFVTPFIRAQVNGWEITGLAAPRSTVVLTATDTHGVPRLVVSAYAYADSAFYFSLDYAGKTPLHPLQPGEQIIVQAAGQVLTMTVQDVTAHADVMSGQVWGDAPAGQAVEVLRCSGPLNTYNSYLWKQIPVDQTLVTATTAGQYTATLPLANADYGAALTTAPEGHQTFARFAVPYLWVRIGKNPIYYYYDVPGYRAWGQVNDPAAPITIAIQGPSGYLKDLRTTVADGGGYFADSPYYGYYSSGLVVETGDVITVSTPRGAHISLVVPTLTAQAFPVSNTVAGRAAPGSRLTITVYGYPYPTPTPYPAPTIYPIWTPTPHIAKPEGGYGNAYTLIVTATAQGDYAADFSGVADISSSTYGEVQMTAPAGYTLSRVFQAAKSCEPALSSIQVGGNLVQGANEYGCPAFWVRLRDAHGVIKAQGYTYSSPTFDFYFYDGARPVSILPGDSVELETGGPVVPPITPTPTQTPYYLAPSGAQGQVISAAVPALTLALDPAANTLSGQAPPNAKLAVSVYHEWALEHQLSTTAGATGTFTLSLAGLHLLAPGDRVQASLGPEGMPFYTEQALLLLKATLYESAPIQGSLSPLTSYAISVFSPRHAPVQVSGYASSQSSFDAWLTTLMPGDSVSIATPQQALQWTLPDLTATIHRAEASVSGIAPPNARLQVVLNQSTTSVTATAQGIYTATFSELAPVSVAHGSVTLDQDSLQVRLDFATPFWRVALDNRCVSGEVETAGVPLNATLASSDGTLKSIVATTTDYGSTRFGVCFTTTVQSSDRLTLTYPTGSMAWTVPDLTAQHDYARRVLEGRAWPNQSIVATFYSLYYGGWLNRRTMTDAGGRYGIDTSDLGLAPRQTGYVAMTDQVGNTIQRDFSIQGYRQFLPVIMRSP